MKTFFQKIFPHLLKGKVAVNCPLSNLMSVKARAYGLHHFHTHQTTRWPFMPCEWDSGKQVPSASRRFIKRWSRVITLKNFPFVISAPPSKRTSSSKTTTQPLHSWSPRSYWRFQHSGFLFNLFSDRPDLTKKPEVKKEQAASQLLFNTVFHSTQMWNNTHRVWFLNAHHLII